MKQEKAKVPELKNDEGRFPTPSLQWNDIIKVIGSVAGFIGLGGALLWLFGRYFYTGLFSAFGFPSLTVSIAPEDYLEKGISSLIYFFLDLLFTIFLYYLAYLFKISFYENILKHTKTYVTRIISILLVFTIGIIAGILLVDTSNLGISVSYFYENTINLLAVFMIFMGLEVAFLIASPIGLKIQKEPSESQSIISSQTPIALSRILIMIAMLGNFLTIQSSASLVNGYMAGCVITLRKTTSIVIFSNNPILIEGQIRTQDLYTYNDYFLLFTDKDNYYLYRETNVSNNKPKYLFVVSKDVAKTIQTTGIPVTTDEIQKYSELCIKKFKTVKLPGGTS
ncbi:MAG: hypothetical protein ABI904_23570 [Chloroflexota bacterium]